VVFTNVESVDRIIYAIFSRFNQDWQNRTLELFTQAAWRHREGNRAWLSNKRGRYFQPHK